VAKIRRTAGPSEIASENGRLRVFVQANVQERDLGGFMAELQQRLRDEVKLEHGMTIEFSGQYENQLRAQRTLLLIVPTVLVIIFLLLFIVYRSVKEAAHVILAVPFALTGGVFPAVPARLPFQRGGVGRIHRALRDGDSDRRRDGGLSRGDVEQEAGGSAAGFQSRRSLQAIKDGARLRLRPKVMTVATIVASLLPIMWSTRTGAEVMKPLATPVIGGMLSSLVHILIVTPVIFAWLRERELRRPGKVLAA
jgi:Cu(I)/Ag(I) efflux system membrane protein CusA/SilA